MFHLQNWEELLEARGDLSDKLCEMGDSIVYRLVQWTKRLPFYAELPVEVHTRVLTHKWHELLVLTTSAWHAMHSPAPPPGVSAEEETLDNLQGELTFILSHSADTFMHFNTPKVSYSTFLAYQSTNLFVLCFAVLQRCLQAMMGRSLVGQIIIR